MHVRTQHIETTRTTALLLFVSLLCAVAAAYLISGGTNGKGSTSTPTISDPSLPHAFPGSN